MPPHTLFLGPDIMPGVLGTVPVPFAMVLVVVDVHPLASVTV